MIIIFLNGFHDAAHNALFRKRLDNLRFCYILELFGSNNFIWRRRHLLLHYPYPNVLNWDIDMKQSDLARIFRRPDGCLFTDNGREQNLFKTWEL